MGKAVRNLMNHAYQGAYTAIVTPFTSGGGEMDFGGLTALCEFQVKCGISGIISVGTTGESPTLTWDEHRRAFEATFDAVGSKTTVVASTGSNSSAECHEATKHARDLGIGSVLLVDPYYNGPSSLEIRREYLEPIASSFPDIGIIPYIIPGRCGTQLLPQDLAIAHNHHSNICAVKEATGDFGNMRKIRELCGRNFTILSGDDDKTLQMMQAPDISCAGVISVVSNVAPKSVQEMCDYALKGDGRAAHVADSLKELFEIVTLKTVEETPHGQTSFKARNPLPIKTLMGVLGMPGGPLRPPMGKMTKQGITLLLAKARRVQNEHPEVFAPLAEFFDVDIDQRLSTEEHRRGWYYDAY